MILFSFRSKISLINIVVVMVQLTDGTFERALLKEVESRTQGLRPRPRTQKQSEAKAEDSLSEDRTSRGQGQECSRPRPRTQKQSEAKAEDSLSEDRTSRGQGQECSRPRPRTQAQAFSKKKGLQKFFFMRSPIYWRTQNF